MRIPSAAAAAMIHSPVAPTCIVSCSVEFARRHTLSVMGYNRDVNWETLLERVTRIMQDNVRAVVQ